MAEKPVAGKPVPATRVAAKAVAAKLILGKRLLENTTRVYVSAGRAAGVRPTDLVGALTAGAGIPRDAIGAIELDDRFSLVEVRDSDADAVVDALRRIKIRGREVTASRYRPPRTRRG